MSSTRKASKTSRRSSRKPVGQRLVQSMREIVDALESGRPLEEQLTVRSVEINDPGTYNARQIRSLRAKLGASQAVFAKMLGVSTVLVQHWEQGLTVPRPIARRLLDEVSRDPATFAGRAFRRVRASA
ncbi:MAG: putative transcriptional regulator [Phycisphaerales bacterium]|nr:putative transcriptional regulator [Phycisphaerales bacterium]